MSKISTEIEKLLERIKILEAENDDLAERAEETILTSLVAETLQMFDEQDLILEHVMERIAILKNIPACLCFSIQEDIATYLIGYLINENLFDIPERVPISLKLNTLMEEGIVITDDSDPNCNLLDLFKSNSFTPKSICLITFSCRSIKNGLLVLVSDEDKSRFESLSLLFQNVLDMTTNRLDNLKLISELEQLNEELNSRVLKRTRELSKLNEALKEEIEERKKIEKDLISAKEEAEKSNELKSQFLAQMSHEIRTPINTILNFSSLVQMEVGDSASEDIHYSFLAIENAANRLIRTINLILDMSQVQLGTYIPQFRTVNLISDILKPAVNEFTHLAKKKNLKLDLCSKCDEIKVNLDEYTANQIFLNLLDNAIKYTPEGKVNINVKPNNSSVYVEIEDTGIGISKEYLPKLFDEFSQEHQGYTRKYDGNGLGLALVKEYCKYNRASIKVDSKKNIGTKFTITFPIK